MGTETPRKVPDDAGYGGGGDEGQEGLLREQEEGSYTLLGRKRTSTSTRVLSFRQWQGFVRQVTYLTSADQLVLD